MSWCVVIPTYNNEGTLEKVIRDVLSVTADVIVVNDGSTDATSRILDRFPELRVISYPRNMGKGYALKKGFDLAVRSGYQHAVTLDSDGQHYASDIAGFIAGMKKKPEALIVGSRTLPKDKLRKGSGIANRFSNFWFRFITGVNLPDTQCGFRLYPLHLLQHIHFYSRRYEFELEVLVRAEWKGITVTSIPVGVYYPPRHDRISHYRPFRDFLRISLMYTVFVIIALVYVKPFSFLKYLKKENIREFLQKHILQSNDSLAKITVSVMFGVFMGIIPIWGYQLITAIALAYLFRLNKVLVIVGANISLPPLIPFILYLSFLAGSFVTGMRPHEALTYPVTFEFLKRNLFQYIIGSIILAVIVSLSVGISLYVIMKVIRRNRITIM